MRVLKAGKGFVPSSEGMFASVHEIAAGGFGIRLEGQGILSITGKAPGGAADRIGDVLGWTRF
jgi:hypothetical protein